MVMQSLCECAESGSRITSLCRSTFIPFCVSGGTGIRSIMPGRLTLHQTSIIACRAVTSQKGMSNSRLKSMPLSCRNSHPSAQRMSPGNRPLQR